MGTLKEIKNKHYILCNVVMLPTKDKSLIAIRNARISNLVFAKDIFIDYFTKQGFYEPQHLYITSDDEIKEGDWFMLGNVPRICTNCTDITVSTNNIWCNRSLVKKIIATTDESLTIDNTLQNRFNNANHGKFLLPQPSQSFIKKYCELGGIDKVLVEYTQNRCHGHLEYTTNSGIPGDWYVCIKCNNIQKRTQNGCINNIGEYKLKTDSHNTITIKSVKNSWTREEVIDIIYKSSFVLSNGDTTKEHADNWINKNL